MLSGCLRVAFGLLFDCLLLAVALALLRILFAVVYIVEYVVEQVVEQLVVYLTSCPLLYGCFRFAFWLLCESLVFAMAVVLLRMLFAVASVVEYVLAHVV